MKNFGDFIFQIGKFLLQEKKWWLVPIIVVFVLVGGLVIATQGSVIAPFIYTMF